MINTSYTPSFASGSIYAIDKPRNVNKAIRLERFIELQQESSRLGRILSYPTIPAVKVKNFSTKWFIELPQEFKEQFEKDCKIFKVKFFHK